MTAPSSWPRRVLRCVVHRVQVVVGGAALTLAAFLVLPVMATIGKPPAPDLLLRTVDTTVAPPPPAPPEPEPEPPPAPDEPPPQFDEPAAPLELAQLELALAPGVGGDGLSGDLTARLLPAPAQAAAGDVEALFSIADLDQPPRARHQPSPVLTPEARRRAPGTVHVLFLVGVDGRVENPIVQKSSDPVFEQAALAAIKQWRFEPGKRNGKPVRFRMRQPFVFPRG